MHAVTAGINYQCRLVLIFTTPSTSGYVDGAVEIHVYCKKISLLCCLRTFIVISQTTSLSYWDVGNGKPWNTLPTHLTWILVTSISFLRDHRFQDVLSVLRALGSFLADITINILSVDSNTFPIFDKRLQALPVVTLQRFNTFLLIRS